MAQYLFTEIVFDLDTRRIVSYKLKPWADEFIMLRMELYHQEFGDMSEGTEGYQKALEKEECNELLGCCNPLPHRGLHNTSVFEHLRDAARRMIAETYRALLLPTTPITRLTPPKHERNREIRRRHQQGESLRRLAQVFGISEQRVYQIVRGKRK